MVDRRAKKQEFQSALKNRAYDPYDLARVIRVIPPTVVRKENEKDKNNNNGRQESCHDDNGTDWSGVVTAWLNALDAAEAGQAVKCYECQASLHSQFNQLFASSPGNILIPALHSICRSTHKTAVVADQGSPDNARLQNAVTLLQESFSRTYNDRKELRPGEALNDQEGSKKVGVLGIVNELFCIYFQLNTLRLCKNLVKPVEARKLHLEGTGGASKGQLVTYKYYTGRLNLFEDQYAEAEENLEYAYSVAHKDAYHNKRCILRYLIPVKLYRGRLPTPELLEKYKLHEFVPLVAGIRKGDLKTFNNALVDFQHRFIRQGTYLLLEKCKTVCYRNLFKRIHIVLDKKHQISLQHVTTAFKWLGMPIDLDEVECILANLIYRGYVRGYLSHSKRVLVLSKRDPFPISSVIAK